MSRAVWLRRASWLAAALAAACGTDTIDLLPSSPVGAGGSASGAGGSAGNDFAGTSSGGSAAASGATSGGSGASSGGGGAGGCSGFGCGGFGSDAGFGGDGGECKDFEVFCPCGPQGRCGYGAKCNTRLGRCMPKCDNPFECGGEGFLCEDHSCASCNDDEQCEQYGSFERRVCVDGRCQECEGPSDCPEEEPICVGQRCIQCLNDEDCASGVCDEPRGRCEK